MYIYDYNYTCMCGSSGSDTVVSMYMWTSIFAYAWRESFSRPSRNADATISRQMISVVGAVINAVVVIETGSLSVM